MVVLRQLVILTFYFFKRQNSLKFESKNTIGHKFLFLYITVRYDLISFSTNISFELDNYFNVYLRLTRLYIFL
jgi:hypothetical protein